MQLLQSIQLLLSMWLQWSMQLLQTNVHYQLFPVGLLLWFLCWGLMFQLTAELSGYWEQPWLGLPWRIAIVINCCCCCCCNWCMHWSCCCCCKCCAICIWWMRGFKACWNWLMTLDNHANCCNCWGSAGAIGGGGGLFTGTNCCKCLFVAALGWSANLAPTGTWATDFSPILSLLDSWFGAGNTSSLGFPAQQGHWHLFVSGLTLYFVVHSLCWTM